MKFAVLGATGPTGVLLVEECLEQGHEVIALVRNPDKLKIQHDRLSVNKVDIFNQNDLVPHLRGTDAMMSCLGSQSFFLSACSLYTDSVKVFTDALREAGGTRFVAITSWGTKPDATLPWVYKFLLRPFVLRNLLPNMGEMEDYLTQNCQDLDYTVVRPGNLTDRQSSGQDVMAVDGQCVPGTTWNIPRRDVAKFMLKCVVNGEWKKKHVSIGVK